MSSPRVLGWRVSSNPPGYLIVGAPDGVAGLDDNGRLASGQEPEGTALAVASVKTSAYTSPGNEIIPADATSAAFTVKLPNAPADGNRVCVKKIDANTANAVTVQCQGSDVLNKAAGATTTTLSLSNQAVVLQYKAAGAIWYVTGDGLPLSGVVGAFESRRRVDLSSRLGSYSAPTDGSADAQAAIQAAITDGVPFRLGPNNPAGDGTAQFRCGSQLNLTTGTDMEIDKNATLIKDFVGVLIGQADYTTYVREVTIVCRGGRIRAASTARTGSLVKLRVSEALIDGLTADLWAAGRFMDLLGDFIELRSPRCFGSDGLAGSGGIRYYAGRGFRCYSGDVISGDDCYQLVPSGNTVDPWWNLGPEDGEIVGIIDARYSGGRGKSLAGKLMVAALQVGGSPVFGDVSAGMTSQVIDSGWRDITGSGKSGVVRIQNTNSVGGLIGIHAERCSADQTSASSTGRIAEISVLKYGSATGPVHRIRLGVKVRNPQYSTVKVLGGCDEILVDGMDATRGAQATDLPVLDMTGGFEIRGGTIDGGNTNADVIQSAPNDQSGAPVQPVIRPDKVIGIADGYNGVFLSSATAPVVAGKFTPANLSSTTAVAVKAGSSVTDALLTRVDVSDFAGGATPVVDAGARTVIDGSCLGVTAKNVPGVIWSAWKPTSGTYTAAPGDQLLVDTSGGTFAITLPTATGLIAAFANKGVRIKWKTGTVAPTIGGSATDPSFPGFATVGDLYEFSGDGTTYWVV